MGRIGTLRARWSVLSRRRRTAVMASVTFVAVAAVGAGAAAGSGHGTRTPVVWRDHVADRPTTTTGVGVLD
jgi:hypothetical protein